MFKGISITLIRTKFNISTGQELRPDRHALYSLIFAILLALTPHIMRLPSWIAVLAVIVFVWRYKIINSRLRPPRSLLRIVVLFSVLYFVFQHYHTLLGRDAGVAMLISLTLLKFIELNTLRDYMLVIFLCLFIALTAFLYSQSIWLGVYLLGVVMILFTVMMYLNHSNRHRPHTMLKRAAAMVMTGLPVAILLFLLFPRLQGGLFGLPADSHSGLTGMSETMKPGSINELNLSEKVAFRVEFKNSVPTQVQRYWRGLVLEVYEQGVWRKRQKEAKVSARVELKKAGVVEYRLMQEPSNKKWVFALDLPISKPDSLKWSGGQTLRSSGAIRDREQWLLTSAMQYRLPLESRSEYRINLVSKAVRGEQLRQLATELYRKAGSNRAYIDAVLNYYRNEDFYYTLQPPLTGSAPVQTFMLETRKGYCEHYASSFTIMMRLAGIPARVVLGYQGGEWNEQGDYLIVRQSDAHAWSEVWLEDAGWVRVDPTAAVAPERIEYGLSAVRELIRQGKPLGNVAGDELQKILAGSLFSRTVKDMKLFWDGVNTRWYKWVIDYGAKNQRGLLRWAGFRKNDWSMLVFLLVGLVTLVVSIQAWLLFRNRKNVDPAVQQYQVFCARLARVGFERLPSEGAFSFARRVIGHRPDLQKKVNAVTGMFVAILYGGLDNDGLQQKLTREVKQFRPGKRKL